MSILYRYVGLPKHWALINRDDIEVSEIRFEKIIKGIDNISEKPVQILWVGQVAPIVNYIIESKGISEVRGIDFTEYFGSVFAKEAPPVILGKYTVVYNVGLEKALNLTFSKQILHGLIQKITDFGGHTFLQTNCELDKLRRDYGIDFANVVKLPEIKEGKIL